MNQDLTYSDEFPQVPTEAAGEVRAAISRLRAALDALEASLAAAEPAIPERAEDTSPVPAGPWASRVQTAGPGDPTAPAPPSSPSSAPEAPSGWGAWSQGPSSGAGSWDTPSDQSERTEEDDAGAREQVRRAVEQMRAEFGSTRLDPAPAGEDAEPEADIPAEVPEETAATIDEDDAARDEVRRAVESTKAELGMAEPRRIVDLATFARSAEEGGRIPTFEPLLNEHFLQPASLVIDDPQGRVELVRVFRTLARLDCAATANLANYSSHSVTVQLEERQPPSQSDIEDAIRYAFERDCSVELDGNRAIVRLMAAA